MILLESVSPNGAKCHQGGRQLSKERQTYYLHDKEAETAERVAWTETSKPDHVRSGKGDAGDGGNCHGAETSSRSRLASK